MADLANQVVRETILAKIPQKPPFRFIEKITELSGEHSIGEYTFKRDEYFYKGHFPSGPVTPGVILIESMAQIGLVTIGLYQIFLQKNTLDNAPNFFFSECEVEFQRPVLPPSRVTVESKKIFYKHNKLKAEITMKNESKEMIASGILSGFAVVQSYYGAK